MDDDLMMWLLLWQSLNEYEEREKEDKIEK